MNKKEKIKVLLFALLGLLLSVMLVSDSKGVSQAVIACTDVCLNSLIPSLFGYMMLCTLLTQSGLGNLIFMPLWYILRHIIKLDSAMFSVFAMSQIGGYPVGVKLISTLIAQNKKYNEIAESCALFCYNSGPAFIAGVVGFTVYNSFQAGMYVFIACLTANFIIGAFMTFKFKPEKNIKKRAPDLSAATVKKSLMSTGSALLTVCLSMIMFNTVLELIRYLGINLSDGKIVNTVIMSVWEITNIKNSGAALPLPVAAALVSFGGICVIFQVLALSDFKLNALKFTAVRMISAALSGLICFALTCIFGFEPSVSTSGFYAPSVLIDDPLVTICVLSMTVILLSYITPLKRKT